VVVLVISHYQLLLLEFICQTKHAETKLKTRPARNPRSWDQRVGGGMGTQGRMPEDRLPFMNFK